MNIMDIVYIILAVLLIIIILILVKYNQLIRLQNGVKNAKANIDTCLSKRFDLIPNIVECVKSYSKYEGETLDDIVSLRNNYLHNKDLNIKQVEQMNDKLSHFFATVESYPDLKANTQYNNLHQELSRIEDELKNARIAYNSDVTRYNTLIETVPSNIVASMFAFKKAELFQAENHKKDDIHINL